MTLKGRELLVLTLLQVWGISRFLSHAIGSPFVQ